ncbi:hypothetical protein CKAN_01734400 [Cinnamomum micranthum f. kanehirae]|uniref:Large ribosomal subunit protein uL5 N-terminal domain-containing protein n=1 Tax=Cinnamomum micranthum f. kanehirae TaxID=337451 RepID=A0A443PC51_9MAGN|nr:hypothetical protein CKAN_01734400 [Cinnamomum micranthum f. kanehirae]
MVPQIEKIVLNCGMGDASQNSKGLEAAIKNMSLISGQRPVKTKARQGIASFKLREGQTVGIMATLRGKEHNLSLHSLSSVAATWWIFKFLGFYCGKYTQSLEI